MPARNPVSRTPWLDRINACFERTRFKAGTCSGTGGISARAYAEGAMTPAHASLRVPGVNQ